MLGLNGHSDALPLMAQKMEALQGTYSERREVAILNITWNTNAHIPNSPSDYTMLFNTNGQPPPDVIAVAFQEVVELNAVNVLQKHKIQEVELWRTVVQ
jgi:phosphatidylinositol-bisphosphatase